MSNSLRPRGLQHATFPCLSLSEFAQTHVHWVSDAIQPSHPLSPPSLPSLNLSHVRVFSNESALPIRWPKYWSFSISPSNEYSELISFRMDLFDLLAAQGLLKCKWPYFILFWVSVVFRCIHAPSIEGWNRVFFSFDLWVPLATERNLLRAACLCRIQPRHRSLFFMRVEFSSGAECRGCRHITQPEGGGLCLRA